MKKLITLLFTGICLALTGCGSLSPSPQKDIQKTKENKNLEFFLGKSITLPKNPVLMGSFPIKCDENGTDIKMDFYGSKDDGENMRSKINLVYEVGKDTPFAAFYPKHLVLDKNYDGKIDQVISRENPESDTNVCNHIPKKKNLFKPMPNLYGLSLDATHEIECKSGKVILESYVDKEGIQKALTATRKGAAKPFGIMIKRKELFYFYDELIVDNGANGGKAEDGVPDAFYNMGKYSDSNICDDHPDSPYKELKKIIGISF